MSNAPFHDTVTLFLMTDDPSVWEIRRIGTVRCCVSEALKESDRRATVYLPLCGRRALRYRTPDDFRSRPSAECFTVRPGDRLVPTLSRALEPPSEALTVTAVTAHTLGTRRLWHLEIQASYIAPTPTEEETNGTGDSEGENGTEEEALS